MKEKFKNLKQNNHNKLVRLFFMFCLIASIIAIVVVIFCKTNIWQKINSIDKIKNIVEKGGVFSCLIFVIFQILQTTILQIPAIVITLAGTIIFGKWLAFFLSFVSILIGSCIMFWIGRKGGKKFLKFVLGDEKSKKISQRISNCKYLFVLMMLFPLFPDDILCAIAGITNMSFKFFFITNIIARFIGIGCTVFLGTGSVIPFSGWGIIIWGVILVFITGIFYVSIKYQDKIDSILNEMFSKKK